jgi:NTP pyrophosphatase (non-canonical NTP hydrolase)
MKIQTEVYIWSLNNFGDQPSINPLLGIVEEVGELAHSVLKKRQAIRVNEDHDNNIKDALGDIYIYMCDFAARENIDLEQAIKETWDKVKERNWNKNKEDGTNQN